MDSLTHSQKTRQGMLKAAKAGKHIGRPPKWTMKAKDGSLRIREDILSFIKAYLPYAEGMTCKHDMELLINFMLPKVQANISIQDLRRIRRSSFYYGYVKYQSEYYGLNDSNSEIQEFWDMRLGIQELVNSRPLGSRPESQAEKILKQNAKKKARVKKFLSPLDKIQ